MSPSMDRRICVAPMLGWTDRHARFFLRQISRRVCLYSEMLSPEPIARGRGEAFIRYDPAEHPVAYQLGGSDPVTLTAAARVLERAGYDEVNFNVGCPSRKGKVGLFGAHLFRMPELVTRCVEAMQAAVSIPVTVKTRIGVDRDEARPSDEPINRFSPRPLRAEDYEPLGAFVRAVSACGCRVFYIHARKAWLDGLSPHANRAVPPLCYDQVYRLKREHPDLTIVINGGITEWSEARKHLDEVDGVMVGRRAYKDPYWLATVDRDFFGSTEAPPTRLEILQRCVPYVERELARGTPLRAILRHMIALYRGASAARVFRRLVTEGCNDDGDLSTYLRLIDACSRERKAD